VRVLTQVQPLVARPTPTTGRDKVSPGRQQTDVRPARRRGGPSALWRMCHLTISREDRTKPRIRREPHGADRRLNGHHATPTANEWSGWLVNITS
jgi:hypothetical protein